MLFTDQSLTCCGVFFFSDSDDTDDWDFEVFSKPSEVQNELYAGNEDEEEEVEDVDGKKVRVRSQILGEVNTKDLYTPNSGSSFKPFGALLCPNRCFSPETERWWGARK